MDRLTALEFVAASENFPQLFRIRRASDGEILFELTLINWCRIGFGSPLMFENQQDLVIEGAGLGKPYWNDEQPPLLDGQQQLAQIKLIRETALAQLRAASISATPRQMQGVM